MVHQREKSGSGRARPHSTSSFACPFRSLSLSVLVSQFRNLLCNILLWHSTCNRTHGARYAKNNAGDSGRAGDAGVATTSYRSTRHINYDWLSARNRQHQERSHLRAASPLALADLVQRMPFTLAPAPAYVDADIPLALIFTPSAFGHDN